MKKKKHYELNGKIKVLIKRVNHNQALLIKIMFFFKKYIYI